MTFKLSKRSKERLEGVDSRILEIIQEALKLTPVDFGIPKHGGVRTVLEQYVLYEQGLSKCDGTRKTSRHQTGNAFDIYAYVDGKASWDTFDLTQVAAAILQAASNLGYSLNWGGNWKRWKDLPHFELALLSLDK